MTVLTYAEPSYAAPPSSSEPLAIAGSLGEVIGNVKAWLTGLAVAVWGAMFVYGALLYSAAGIGTKEMGKQTMRYACIGFVLTMLAPLALTILQGFVD
ncbi:pilin [Fodinicola acaciae]|uniref:pilin n=1 Tax=Fodinicola acaciae TaxID=2681555 RepID=UPI0013D32156|nr:pilin [Fodinicola acaciae]